MRKILFLIGSCAIFYSCKNDGYVWGNAEFEMNGVLIKTRDFTFNRSVVRTDEIALLRHKENLENTFPSFKNLQLIEKKRFTLHKEKEPGQEPFLSVIEWGSFDVFRCGNFDLLEEDSINNWFIFDEISSNKRHIKGRFSGTYVFKRNNCNYPTPIQSDTVTIRNGSFNLRD
jgi:hypothetical protein